VVIPEGAAGGPAVDGDARALGHVGEGTLPGVAVEPVAAESGDVQVGPAVVVEVALAHALAPAPVCHPRRRGHVGERAVVIVVEERGRGRRFTAGQRGPGRSVHEVDVEPAVVVVIPERDAGAGRLDDVVLRDVTRHMPKGRKARGSRYVDETYARGGIRRRRRRGDGRRQGPRRGEQQE